MACSSVIPLNKFTSAFAATGVVQVAFTVQVVAAGVQSRGLPFFAVAPPFEATVAIGRTGVTRPVGWGPAKRNTMPTPRIKPPMPPAAVIVLRLGPTG